MRIFNLSENFSVVCESQSTRNGFRHVATLLRNGNEFARAKCTYLNRTWECYQFESVLYKIVNDNFTGQEKENFQAVVKNFR